MAGALWILFFSVIGVLVALDVGLGKRRRRETPPLEALASTCLWVLGAIAFAYLLAFSYEQNLLGLGVRGGHHSSAKDVWLQFSTAYITEIALSLDNIGILALIFSRYHVRPAVRSQVLFWAILIPILLRSGLIDICERVAWQGQMRYLFAGLLALAAIRTLLLPDSERSFDRSLLVRLCMNVSARFSSHPEPSTDAVTRQRPGRRIPLLFVILLAVTADLSLAVDSVPAVLSITRDPVIGITSNTLAVLALRSMYYALSGVIGRFRFLNLVVTAVLFGLSGKLAAGAMGDQATVITLVSVIGATAIGLGISIPFSRRMAPDPDRPTPLQDVTEAVAATRRNLRKVVILIVGTIVILFGVAIAPIPGPGPTIIVPIGLAILATEFLWARTLLNKLKEQTELLQQKADRLASRTSPWLLPPVIVLFWAAAWAIIHYAHAKPLMGWVAASGLFLPVGYWAFKVLTRARKSPRTDAGLKSPSESISPTHSAHSGFPPDQS